MFEFIREINPTLYKDFDDINKNIKLKTSLCETALQIFAERLLKIINEKEKILVRNKISLGDLLNNEIFLNKLSKKYDYSEELIRNLEIINNLSNDHKHENRSEFIEKELKKMYRKLLYCAVNYYNISFSKEIKLDNINQYYDDLLKPDDELVNKIREEIRKSFEEEKKDRETLIKEQKQNLQIKEQQLEKATLKLKEFNQIKSKIIDLENENSNYNNMIDEYNAKISELEAKVNDKNDDDLLFEREDLLKKLKEKEELLQKNQIEIETLKENNSINPTIDVDQYNKIIYELKEKISILENQQEYNDSVKNDELFATQMRLNRKICFDNSYIENDVAYILRNVTLKTSCTSKYKQFYAVLNNLLQRGQIIETSNLLKNKSLTDNELKEICRLQMLILTLLKNDVLKDSIWRINYINGNKKLLEIAIIDIFEYIEDFTSLANVSFERPKIDLTTSAYSNDELRINIGYNIEYNLSAKYMFYIEDYEETILSDDLKDDRIININYWIEKSIKYDVNQNNSNILKKYLKLIFGYDEFRPGQLEIIAHTLSGKNTIGILPTGSGKSIVYQLSSLLQPKISIVIAPTKELIKDQCRILNQRFGITRTSRITSDKDVNKNFELQKLGKLKNVFTFISPERLQSEEFRSKLLILKDENAFDKIILDEVHCLSEWGHDFRIPYLMVAHTIKQYCPDIKFLGLTATASKSVIKDLMIELNIESRNDIIFNETYKRDNLTFEFDNYLSENEMIYEIKDELLNEDVNLNGEKTNAAIIFMKTSYMVDDLYKQLSRSDSFGDIVGRYYSTDDNSLSTEKFINNEESVLVSTKAFGMGIDKPNIRLTIHYGVPSSLEAFYQEAGRAGREIGSKAKCKIFTYKYSDEQLDLINEFFNENTSIERLRELTEHKLLQWKVDIATNFYFLTQNLEEPSDETNGTLTFFKNIYSHINGDNKYRNIFPRWVNTGKRKPEDNKPIIEKKLYILHKCGIVDNWEVKYLDNSLEFNILFDSEYKNIDYIKARTRQYINQYPDDHKSIISTINSVSSYNRLYDVIYNMRKWYYDNFILTRRMQLKNIYKYATFEYNGKGKSNIIQNVIDDYFNIASIIKPSKDGTIVYGFENISLKSVIRKAVLTKKEDIDSSIVKIESEMESVVNNKMRVYLALLNLRKNNYNSQTIKELLDFAITSSDYQEKVDIYKTIKDEAYNKFDDDEKDLLLQILYSQDKKLFRGIILDELEKDKISIKYWIPYINNRFES